MVKTDFGVLPPPKKKILMWGLYKNLLKKNDKNQSCSKLPEMARKLVEQIFGVFSPPNKSTQKNQSCLQLPEMVKQIFGFLARRRQNHDMVEEVIHIVPTLCNLFFV